MINKVVNSSTDLNKKLLFAFAQHFSSRRLIEIINLKFLQLDDDESQANGKQ